MDRYEGKPFLRLLECYVLDVIGHLHESHRKLLQQMEPKLANTYGMKGTWIEIVAAQMEFPESLRPRIRQIWENGLKAAKERNMPVDPNEFAMAFVDQNFPMDDQ